MPAYLLENCGALRAALRPYFFLSFILGSRVRIAGLLEGGSVGFVSLEQRSGKAVSDCACLAGKAAALDRCDNIELALCAGGAVGLVDNQLQRFKTEIVVDIASIDGNNAGAGNNADSGD